jgi:uncharacterized phiE125 gp8 family phage protein
VIRLVTPPSTDTEPVLVNDVRNMPGMRLDTMDDDVELAGLISDAREACENYTRMSLMTQTWDLVLDAAGYSIDLPRPPLASVTGIYVTDDAGVETTVDPTTYRVDTVTTPGRVFLKPGYSWPYYTEQAGFRIRYVAGYTTAASVPRGIVKAIKLLVAYLYNNPGDAAKASGLQLPDDVKIMLDPFKVYL